MGAGGAGGGRVYAGGAGGRPGLIGRRDGHAAGRRLERGGLPPFGQGGRGGQVPTRVGGAQHDEPDTGSGCGDRGRFDGGIGRRVDRGLVPVDRRGGVHAGVRGDPPGEPARVLDREGVGGRLRAAGELAEDGEPDLVLDRVGADRGPAAGSGDGVVVVHGDGGQEEITVDGAGRFVDHHGGPAAVGPTGRRRPGGDRARRRRRRREGDAGQPAGSGSPFEHPQRAVGGHLEIDDVAQPGGESGTGPGTRVESADLTVAKVHVQVRADEGGREHGGRRVVEGAAREGTAAVGAAVAVGEERIGEGRVAPVRAFEGRPAVVRPGGPLVDLFERALPDVVDEQPARAGLEVANVNGLRRPRAQMARLAPVAVVKNGLSVGMLPSALIAEDLAEPVGEGLGVGAVGIVADGYDTACRRARTCRAPPLWLVAELRLSRSTRTTSLPGWATSPWR